MEKKLRKELIEFKEMGCSLNYGTGNFPVSISISQQWQDAKKGTNQFLNIPRKKYESINPNNK